MGRISLFVICVALLAGASGCETVNGAGRDIEKAGEAIQRAAR